MRADNGGLSYRSWLEDVKVISDLGDHLHSVSPYAANFEEVDIACLARRMALRDKPVPVAEEFRPYFQSRMYDSAIIGVKLEGGRFVLSVSNDLAACFSMSLAEALDMENPVELFRVDLECLGVSYASFLRPNGEMLVDVGWPKFRPPFDVTRADRFVADWFFARDGRIQWVAELRAWEGRDVDLDLELYLLVDCDGVRAVDAREAALVGVWSPAVLPLWAEAQRPQRQPWDFSFLYEMDLEPLRQSLRAMERR